MIKPGHAVLLVYRSIGDKKGSLFMIRLAYEGVYTLCGQHSFDERKKQGNLPVVVIWKVTVVHWEKRVKKRVDGWPQAFGIFGSLIDGFNIGCCT